MKYLSLNMYVIGRWCKRIMEEMLDKGIKLPKDSFADYFDEVYETDCEKFLKIFMLKLNY